jgi:hypothetical protein
MFTDFSPICNTEIMASAILFLLSSFLNLASAILRSPGSLHQLTVFIIVFLCKVCISVTKFE